MKDLDFDELDKAVNSLMTNVPKTDTTTPDTPVEKTVDITPTLDTNTPPPFDKLSESAAQAAPAASDNASPVVSPQPLASPSMLPASRRGGRFMDVVHPSSDMKKPTIPERPISREGALVERGQDDSASLQVEPLKDTSVTSPSPVVAEKTVPTNEWPDPLDVAGFKHEAMPAKEAAPKTPLLLEEHDTSQEESAPLTSPFLPGAKVEKRPLGSAAPLLLEDPAATESKTVDDPNDQLPAQPADVPPQLPEELQGDLMAVESDTHMGMPKTEETHPSDALASAAQPMPDEKPVSKLPAPAPEPPKEEAPVGPTSIPQQYKEEQSTGDKDSGAIYDTATYHQPLAHPAKKKSGWMWVVWIVIILLVGAGGGAALYFLGVV